jgi:hypothetical protein
LFFHQIGAGFDKVGQSTRRDKAALSVDTVVSLLVMLVVIIVDIVVKGLVDAGKLRTDLPQVSLHEALPNVATAGRREASLLVVAFRCLCDGWQFFDADNVQCGKKAGMSRNSSKT